MRKLFESLNKEVSLVFVEPIAGDAYVTLSLNSFSPKIIKRPLGHTMIPYSSATSLCILAFAFETHQQFHFHRHPFEDIGLRHWTDFQ